jgi:hypothetical protein
MARTASMMLALIAVCFTGGGVASAELAKKGTFDTHFYIHNVQTIAELDTADGMKTYVNEAYEIHAAKQTGTLLDNMAGRCLAYGIYNPDTGAVHEIGRCTAVDADGDKIFEEVEINLKDANDKAPITGRLLGGTGKYQGIKGTLTATVEMMQTTGQGHTMVAGESKGEYSLGD